MATHYAYVLVETGVDTDGKQKALPIQPFLPSVEEMRDITETPDPKYAGLSPDLVLLRLFADATTLDTINAAAGVFELARGTINSDGSLNESSLEVTLTNKDKNDLIAIFQAEIDGAAVNRRTALTDYAASLGVELQGMSKRQALLRLVQAINEMVDL